MNKAFGVFIFVAGAGIGSAATWIFAKKKYLNLAREEIDSVKKAYANKKEVLVKKNDSVDDICSSEVEASADKAARALKKNSIIDYNSVLKRENYVDYSKSGKNEEDEDKKTLGKECPYVISPDEFGELYDYEKVSLTYYSDKVLTDDNDDVIEDIDAVIGVESLDHFGEYEEDSVFVRNDQRMCDYEILLDTRTYSEAVKKSKPYQHQDDDDGEEE